MAREEATRMTAPRSDYTSIELFAGAGGFTLGLEGAGFRCVGAIELDPRRRPRWRGTSAIGRPASSGPRSVTYGTSARAQSRSGFA